MKPAIFIIAALMCIPAIAQEEMARKIEKNLKQQALCRTRLIEDAELRYSPVISDNVNIVLPKGTKVYVYFGSGSYWFIKTDIYEGYVNERRLRVTNMMRWVKRDIYAQEADDTSKKENKPYIGMTRAAARENYGDPDDIKKYLGGKLRSEAEMWIFDNKSLYFQNGVLISYKYYGKYFSHY